MYVYTYICLYMYKHICICIYTYTYTHAYIYAYTYAGFMFKKDRRKMLVFADSMGADADEAMVYMRIMSVLTQSTDIDGDVHLLQQQVRLFFVHRPVACDLASHVTCLFVQPMQKDSTSCGILTNLTLQAMAMRPHGVDPFAIDIPFEVETGILFFLSFFFCILFKLQWHFDHAGLYVHETQVCLKFDGIGWPSARRMACARPANTSGRFA